MKNIRFLVTRICLLVICLMLLTDKSFIETFKQFI
jgi:hypothetical protein